MKNYVVSYPRCGNTFFRYCVEFISEKPTIGYKGSAVFDEQPILKLLGINKYDNLDEDYVLKKAHLSSHIGYLDNGEPVDKCIFIIRDYNECLVRHTGNPKLEALIKTLDKDTVNYMEVLNGYDVCESDKLLIYYEDFITKPKEVLLETIKFLELDTETTLNNLDELINNYEEHRTNGVGIYNRGAKSYTGGKNVKFHSNKLTKETKESLDNYIKTNYKTLFEKYLDRYKN